MKSIKRFAKKSLSLILCLAMVMTTVIFFDIGITKPEAKVEINNPAEHKDVLFYVPEAIYLRPRSDSWTIGSTSTFHFFIENNVTNGANLVTSPTTNTSAPTTGNVYFQYDDAKDGSVQVYYRWLNSSLSSTLDGNGIRLGSTDVGVNQNLVLNKESGKNYYRTTIIAANSKSPHLGASDTGCYIEWTVKYHDNADNLDKSITAYTYVYKPYVVPIGAGGLGEHAGGDNHWNGQISWISGFHSFKTASSGKVDRKFARYSRASDGSAGFMPFQTRSTTEAINDNTVGAVGTMQSWNLGDRIEEKSSYATQDTLYFASTNTSYSYFMACQDGNKPDNWESTDSYAHATNTPPSNGTPTNSTTFSPENFTFTKQTSDYMDSDDNIRSVCVENNGVASIVVDSSRYSNLGQIPNLGVGMMVTNDAASDGGAWYVADYTGRTNSQPVNDNGKNSPDYYSTALMNNWNDHGTFIVRLGHPQGNRPGGVEYEGVKYSGAWDSAITGSKTHSVKMANYNHDQGEDAILISTILHMSVTAYNKANLRAAVSNAQKEFALLGIYDNSYNSHYYNNTGAYTTFVNAYKTACHALLSVNGVIDNPDTLANSLNNALATLKAEKDVYETDANGNLVYKTNGQTGAFELDTNGNKIPAIKTDSCRKSGIAYQYNAGVIRNEDGSYRIVKITSSSNPVIPYSLRDTVSFSADSYSGYHFLGMYKLESNMNFDALVDESYDIDMSTVPNTTNGDFRQNIRITQNTNDRKTSFVQLGTVSTSTTVATFGSASQVTYPYAYDTDISYIYFYEIDNGEVIFGNEFDFDAFRWVGVNQGATVTDHVNNTITLNTTADANDAYTKNYDNNQKGYMTLVPGRVYEYSCTVKNNTSSVTTGNMFFFTFADVPSGSGVSIGADRTDFTSTYVEIAANGTSTITGTLTVPAGRPYATIRVGSYTPNTSVTFSNICVRDITVFTETVQTNAVTMPDPLHKDGAPNASVTDFPTLTRPGYQLAGWSTVREANGNGAAANIVTSTTIPANGNRTLYPVWQTNVIYKAQEGETLLYRKSADPMQTSYQVEGRWNVDVGTSVPVSNRIPQGQTNWDSADVSYTYVPYKPGYNFKGWKAESVDPSVNGKVYWPTQTVVTNANVEFTAVWGPVYEVGTDEYFRLGSSHNNTDRTFYPGQVHFFKYSTPARNQYVSAYTYSSTGNIMMQLYDSNLEFVMENDNRENSYGIRGMSENDPMIVTSLNESSDYYFGISLSNITDTVVDGANFEITEHTVEYKLQPNGGEIVDLNGDGTTYTNQTQTLIGYDNEQTDLPANGKNYGYEISGWQTASGETKTYPTGTPVSADENHLLIANNKSTLVTEVPLLAQWSPKQFNVTYDLNKGDSSTEPTMNSSQSSLWFKTPGTLTTDEPSMPGYTFKGWSETPNQVSGETLYKKDTATGLNISGDKAESFFRTNDGAGITLYARWAPNLIIVHFKPNSHTTEEIIEEFYFDQERTLEKMQIQEAEQHTIEFYNGDVKIEDLTTMADLVLAGWASSTDENPDYKYYLNADKTLTLVNPNGIYGSSDTVGTDTNLYALWKNAAGDDITDATIVTSPVWERTGYVLAGWANPNDDTPDKTTVDYMAGSKFVPQGDMKLYAVWHSKSIADANEDIFLDFDDMQPVVEGVIFKDADNLEDYETIEALSVPQYDTGDFKTVVDRYKAAKAAFEANKSAANNNELYEAIKALESFDLPTTDDALGSVTAYLDKFKISYADGVTGKIPAGTYSLADMNLNHYTTDLIDVAKGIYDNACLVKSILDQGAVNDAVIDLAQAFVSKSDVKTVTPMFKVYDTAKSALENNITTDSTIKAMNYVYTGKGNVTYYCYTNSENPVLYLTVEDLATDGRVCYPTSAKTDGSVVMTAGATSPMPIVRSITDNAALEKYQSYLDEGIGIARGMEYYTEKALIELRPDFSNVNADAVNGTVTYTLKAYDDSFAVITDPDDKNSDLNFADAAQLASTDEVGKLDDIPNGDKNPTTPKNTITIIIDYHVSDKNGEKLDVNGNDVPEDKWINQYHLARSAGGASNWEFANKDDAIYTIDDPVYGQSNFGSFTYTFNVGGANDFANCVLKSADLEEVKEIVAANFDEISAVPLTPSKITTVFAREKNEDGSDKLDENGKPIVYIKENPAGTGLGYKAWPTGWSFNYYPASQAYTYVHLVDRWGNAVDKIIQTPNMDASPTQFLTQDAGEVTAAEVGGSGIDTMSFSAKSFDIIADENSTFDGNSYTTTGNTIKVYTGEANKKYSLEATDVATNKTTSSATTDSEGYLTITVEDKAFDTQSGAYTFTLNGKEINLYAEVEKKILSAEDVTVEAGETAAVEIITTADVVMVQIVDKDGVTKTATEYTEDKDGNRVWVIEKLLATGEHEFKINYKTGSKWETQSDTVKITVNAAEIFMGVVTAVEYTPSESTTNEFMFTVTGRADKIQVVDPDGSTRTYDRYHAKVIIISYDAEGNIVNSMSRELSYEIWTVEMTLPAGVEFSAIAKYGREWNKSAPYKYTVVLLEHDYDDEVYSMELAETAGWMGSTEATVVTGLDVKGVRFVMDDNTTTTYYEATESDGKLTYKGKVWINHSGDNTIVVKIRVNNAWLNAGELSYYCV